MTDGLGISGIRLLMAIGLFCVPIAGAGTAFANNTPLVNQKCERLVSGEPGSTGGASTASALTSSPLNFKSAKGQGSGQREETQIVPSKFALAYLRLVKHYLESGGEPRVLEELVSRSVLKPVNPFRGNTDSAILQIGNSIDPMLRNISVENWNYIQAEIGEMLNLNQSENEEKQAAEAEAEILGTLHHQSGKPEHVEGVLGTDLRQFKLANGDTLFLKGHVSVSGLKHLTRLSVNSTRVDDSVEFTKIFASEEVLKKLKSIGYFSHFIVDKQDYFVASDKTGVHLLKMEDQQVVLRRTWTREKLLDAFPPDIDWHAGTQGIPISGNQVIVINGVKHFVINFSAVVAALPLSESELTFWAWEFRSFSARSLELAYSGERTYFRTVETGHEKASYVEPENSVPYRLNYSISLASQASQSVSASIPLNQKPTQQAPSSQDTLQQETSPQAAQASGMSHLLHKFKAWFSKAEKPVVQQSQSEVPAGVEMSAAQVPIRNVESRPALLQGPGPKISIEFLRSGIEGLDAQGNLYSLEVSRSALGDLSGTSLNSKSHLLSIVASMIPLNQLAHLSTENIEWATRSIGAPVSIERSSVADGFKSQGLETILLFKQSTLEPGGIRPEFSIVQVDNQEGAKVLLQADLGKNLELPDDTFRLASGKIISARKGSAFLLLKIAKQFVLVYAQDGQMNVVSTLEFPKVDTGSKILILEGHEDAKSMNFYAVVCDGQSGTKFETKIIRIELPKWTKTKKGSL